jgi:hypothetical protein
MGTFRFELLQNLRRGHVQRSSQERLHQVCRGEVQSAKLEFCRPLGQRPRELRPLRLGHVQPDRGPELLPRLPPGHVEHVERIRHDLVHAM